MLFNMALHRSWVVAALILLCNTVAVHSFSGVNIASRSRLNVQTSTCARMSAASSDDKSLDLEQTLRGFVIASAFAVTTFSGIVGMPQSALADEYGVERDAPTLFTGETVMVSCYVPAMSGTFLILKKDKRGNVLIAGQ
jgi:hypothetical protein